ncbi:MAG: hypothetical protein JJU11_14280 [Candidatus Sumerlaeia bacterium]|nr:hypothetical protein [Candidatus Sumerlaeia bacterium]
MTQHRPPRAMYQERISGTHEVDGTQYHHPNLEEGLVKFFKFLPALLVAVALVGTGCGGGDSAEQQAQATAQAADKEALIRDTLRQVNQMQTLVEALSEENASLRRSVGEMQERLIIQRERINDVNRQVSQTRSNLAEGSSRLATPPPAPETGRGLGGFLFLILIIVIGIVVLIIIIRAFAGGGNDFDGEYHDFDHLDDEDFGFEDDDEDFEDEIEDEKDESADDKKKDKKDGDKK